jgi:hypothetical protein
LLEPELYRDVDLAADVVPARVGGTLHGPALGSEVLAIAVNGEIATITRAYVSDGRVGFLAMVHPDYFRSGDNVIEVFEVTGEGDLFDVPAR